MSSSPIHDQKTEKTIVNGGDNVVGRRERPSRACTVRSAARLHAAAAAEAEVRKNKSKKRKVRREVVEEVEEEEEEPASPDNEFSKIVTVLVKEPPLAQMGQMARWNIRSMWELAAVLNFFNVFRSLLNIDAEFSVEELETALITPNATLGDIHIPLLKAIPPVARMTLGSNTWITVLCRKLKEWWHWVAEGELPIVANHGAEIETYNTLDPCVRVIILKALCDIRVEQDDIRHYIDDSIKNGVALSTFRKERTGGNSHGVSYWYEDDPIIGQRLYREIRTVEVKKGKGKNVQSVSSYQWETVATNLDEFQDVSEKLSASKNQTEASLGKKITENMLPEIEKVLKKKEKVLKKQHRQALLLDSMMIDALGPDDYDRSINEALEITKTQPSLEPTSRREGLRRHDASTNGTSVGRSQNSHQPSSSPSSHDSLNYDETDEDHAAEQLDRSNRRRQRPQRYSAHEFVEEVSDNDADMDSDEDVVGEVVYDDDYVKQRKGKRDMSSSSEEDEDEYHLEEENAEEDEGDDSLSASEDSDVPQRSRRLKVSGRTRRSAKLRSVRELRDGLRRSKRATRNRIDYKQYEFSESESELDKPEKSNGSDKNSEASDNPDYSTGSEDTDGNDEHDDNDVYDHDDDDCGGNDDGENDDEENDDEEEEVKVERPSLIEENPTTEKEEKSDPEPPIKEDDPVKDEHEGGAGKRGFLDLNELAPGSGFEDGPIMKDEDDTDNV
ncbi:DDT domain-containing protein [Tanacetum coccineum]